MCVHYNIKAKLKQERQRVRSIIEIIPGAMCWLENSLFDQLSYRNLLNMSRIGLSQRDRFGCLEQTNERTNERRASHGTISSPLNPIANRLRIMAPLAKPRCRGGGLSISIGLQSPLDSITQFCGRVAAIGSSSSSSRNWCWLKRLAALSRRYVTVLSF